MSPKVLFTASTDSHIRSFHRPYLKAFRDMGWTVHVACGGAGDGIPEANRVQTLPFEKRIGAFANFRAMRMLRSMMRENRYDLICAHTALAAFFTRLAALTVAPRPPVVVIVHGYLFRFPPEGWREKLLLRAEEAGAKAACGFEMLVAQAVFAAEYFLGRKFPEGEIERVHGALKSRLVNVSLIGMPPCGKTSIGKALSKRLGKRFVDIDAEIAAAAGMCIPDIFAAEGEAGFRLREAEQAARLAKENGQLLSCGGGIIKTPGNARLLHQNGCVLWIRRPLAALAAGGERPLSRDEAALRAMEAERTPLYAAAADAVIDNDTEFTAAVDAAERAFHEIYRY